MARVLIVDDDPWSQRMVSSVLTHAGHTVDLAADGWEGLVAADHTMPDLLIVEVKLPTADGWKVVETLRSRHEMAHLPTLFLTTFTEQDRRGGCFRPQTDDVLVTPFRLEDLTARVDRLLSQSQNHGEGPTAVNAAPAATPGPTATPAPTATTSPETETETETEKPKAKPKSKAKAATPPPIPVDPPARRAPTPPPVPSASAARAEAGRARAAARAVPTRMALAGVLEQFGAASVLMLLDLERRSGVLIVSAPLGRGRIYVRDGRVLRVSVDTHPHLKGAIAIYELLTWSEGRFEFHAGPVDGEDEIGSSTSFLLMEGARLQDEDAAQKKQN